MGKRVGEKRDETIVVAIDKDKGSQYALKWAVNNLLTEGQSLTLLHIRDSAPPSNESNSDVNGDEGTKELFRPFRCFCTRKKISFDEVISENGDAAKGIIEYVQDNAIETLVVGAPSRRNLLRRFRSADVSSTLSKGAPNFCTVYVISRGKLSSVRSASSQPPARTTLPLQLQNQPSNISDMSDSMPYPKPRAAKRGQQTPHKLQEEMEIKFPFNTKGYAGKDEPSVTETDISFVSSGRPSTDRLFHSFYENQEPGMTPRLSISSEFNDNRSSFASSFSWGKQSIDRSSSQPEFSSCSQENGRLSRSTLRMGDVEAEMRRLKMELKQTMDMYSTACKETLTANQKTTELHPWKLAKEQKLEEARFAEEAATALVEREKVKCKAAIEEAVAAQRIAKLEAQKRKKAEMKSLKEAEETKRVLNAFPQGDLRYRKYTIEEIEKASDYFSDSRKIGEGGYGPVYKGTLDHTPVAIKVLRPDAAQGRSQFQQEVEVLTCTRHPNMVLLLGACPEFGCLVYEYMANGSLEDRIFRRGNTPVLPWQLRFRIAAEISTGLHFLHQTKPKPLVHRDLKPGNILLDSNFVSKIADVGLARLVPPSVANSVTKYRMTATAGTFCYIDPEYQQSGMLGTKSDVYSLGIMLLQIITARAPMGLAHQVERAIEKGTFADILDPAVHGWPVQEALKFAKVALQCAELRRKDRPNLGKIVLPELNRLRALAEGSIPGISFRGSSGAWTSGRRSNNQVSTTLQEIMSDPQLLESGNDSSRSRTSSSSYARST